MTMKLYRRARRITHTDAFVNLNPNERNEFLDRARNSRSEDDLPNKCKEILSAGEREIQGY